MLFLLCFISVSQLLTVFGQSCHPAGKLTHLQLYLEEIPMQHDLASGKLSAIMIRFSVPFLAASFLQTVYGLADLFITGQFNGAAAISAVSIGSQVMHMLTVMIVGLATGTMVMLSRSLGAKQPAEAARSIGNSIVLFLAVSAVSVAVLLVLVDPIILALQAPAESVAQTRQYLSICLAGLPFIIAYNVISSIFRGMGDTKSPMIFVAIAGVINIVLDYLLIGPFGMGAAGAALATVVSQAISVLTSLFAPKKALSAIRLTRRDLRPESSMIHNILMIGVPIAVQEGLIQISFLIITAIANTRGVQVAAAVGIVEKVISFLFLVHSAMLSTVSAVAAQNMGAGFHERSRQALFLGIRICVIFGGAVFILCQIIPEGIVGLFVHGDPEVILLGAQYLRAYSLDCVFAGVHFCFSGYFSAYGRSLYSFVHNMISVLLVRIPGAWLATVLFPQTLYPLGLAAPLGSLLSVGICVVLYRHGRKYFGPSQSDAKA